MIFKNIGYAITNLIIAYIFGKFIFKLTKDIYWVIYNYIFWIFITLSFILLTNYNYLYFYSNFLIFSIILGGMLIHKIDVNQYLNNINNNNKNNTLLNLSSNVFTPKIFLWLLFIISIMVIFLYITKKYLMDYKIRYKVEPTIGNKGIRGNRGIKGDAHQLRDSETDFIYKSLCDHTENIFKKWKINRYIKWIDNNTNERMPESFYVDNNRSQFNNLIFKFHLNRISNSKQTKELINNITNTLVINDSPIIRYDNGINKTIRDLEEKLINSNHLEFMENYFSNSFRLNPGYYIEIDAIDTINYRRQKYKLDSGKYIYYNSCKQHINTGSNNIFEILYNFTKSCDLNGLKISIRLTREMEDFKILRNKALCKTIEYLKIHLTNWIEIILENNNGEFYLSNNMVNDIKIQESINILKDDILLLAYYNDENGINNIFKVNSMVSNLKKLNLTHIRVLRDINFDIEYMNNTINNTQFINTNNLCEENNEKIENSNAMESGKYRIFNKIKKINIDNVNSGNIWNWGSFISKNNKLYCKKKYN